MVRQKKFNPYRIEPPFSISFSGGRSSGYMLYHILDAYDGKLPDDGHVLFANTGKECEESLVYVRDCGRQWGAKIRWFEYDYGIPKTHMKEVDFASASRNGEPFESLIVSRHYLPNQNKRICTYELKVELFKKFMKSCGYDHWYSALGFRADEPRRIAKGRESSKDEQYDNVMPMNESGVTKMRHIIPFWKNQSFDLQLPDNGNGQTLAGNCDLCFLKGMGTTKRLIREEPQRADWWIKMEEAVRQYRKKKGKDGGWRFSFSRPDYVNLKKSALFGKKMQFFPDGDAGISCFCGD